MNAEFVVKFIKDKDYSRFIAHGILPNRRNGNVIIHLYEETMPMMTEFTYLPNGESTYKAEEGSMINYIHATATIPIDRIPQIIGQLQQIYLEHMEEDSGE